jgi:hypothetical protein
LSGVSGVDPSKSKIEIAPPIVSSGMSFPVSSVKRSNNGRVSILLLGLNSRGKTVFTDGQTVATVTLFANQIAIGTRFEAEFDRKSTKLLDISGENMLGLMQKSNVEVQ